MSGMRIAALSGSLRAAAVNSALRRRIAARTPGDVTVSLVALGALPLCNPIISAKLCGSGTLGITTGTPMLRIIRAGRPPASDRQVCIVCCS